MIIQKLMLFGGGLNESGVWTQPGPMTEMFPIEVEEQKSGLCWKATSDVSSIRQRRRGGVYDPSCSHMADIIQTVILMRPQQPGGK